MSNRSIRRPEKHLRRKSDRSRNFDIIKSPGNGVQRRQINGPAMHWTPVLAFLLLYKRVQTN
jgi:hypothetical protein